MSFMIYNAELSGSVAIGCIALVSFCFGDKMEKEICICAAIKDTTGYIWRGHRHADCISSALEAGRKIPMERESEWQGFVTSNNRFVNRYEGYDLQVAAGIESSGGGYRGHRLFSEDLY